MTETWVSAGVATIVTLVIEYFAKPGLEARKDRILDAGRKVRALRTTVHHLYRSIIYLCSDSIWQGSSRLVETELDKCDELNERITDLSIESMAKLPSGLAEQLVGATGIVKGAVLRVRQELDQPVPTAFHIERIREVEPGVETCVRYFDLPKRRILARLRAISAIGEARETFAS